MLKISNETKISPKTTLLEEITKFLSCKDIELVFSDDIGLSKLNNDFLGKIETTDVLSFPFDDMGIIGGNLPLGSIVINLEMASRISSQLGHTLEAEIALLFTHGLLHLLGYDHEIDNGEHREEEVKVIEYFNLPKSLIARGLEKLS